MIKPYDTIEEKLRHAFGSLAARCDGATSRDNAGFNGGEASSAYLQGLLNHPEPYNLYELKRVFDSVNNHRKQLEKNGIEVPTLAEVQTLMKNVRERQEVEEPWKTKVWIHVQNNVIHIRTPYSAKEQWAAFKNTIWSDYVRTGKLSDYPRWDGEKKEFRWTETSYLAFGLLFKAFPQAFLTPEAQKLKYNLDQEQFQKVKAKSEQDTQTKLELMRLVASVNIHSEIASGFFMFDHQKVGYHWLLDGNKRRILADDTGLGKTFGVLVPTLALFRRYHWKIIVTTTVSAQEDWKRMAEAMKLPITVNTWRKIPSPETIGEKYIAIFDEAHKGQSTTSQQGKDMCALALHENCAAVYHLTGTPMKNGRPINLYNLLLTCHHPLVWHEDPKIRYQLKRQYEIKYCNAQKKFYGSREVWDVSGALNLVELNKYTVYVPGRNDNHPHACILRRKKVDCVDMPEKKRVQRYCEVSPAAAKRFAHDVAEVMNNFNKNIEIKLAAAQEEVDRLAADKIPAMMIEIEHDESVPLGQEFMEIERRLLKFKQNKLDQMETDMRNAETMVQFGAFCQAGDRAKSEEALDLASQILEEGNKVVIFTRYDGIATDLAASIKEKCKVEVGVIKGSVSSTKRDAIKLDFQNPNGKIQCVISTAAGGEAITLTAASYMIIIGRPWTPGDVQQWEDRIWRIGQKNHCIIYWLLMPVYLSPADGRVDEIIQKKAVNINTFFGEGQVGIPFADDIGRHAEMWMKETLKKVQKYLN